jgi:hypothetical protein
MVKELLETLRKEGTGNLSRKPSSENQRILHLRPPYRVTLVLAFDQLSEAWEVRRLRGFAEIQIGNYHVFYTLNGALWKSPPKNLASPSH